MKVNVTLVEQLVRQYRVDLNHQPLPPGEAGDPWAIAEKWVTDREVLPAHAPQLGKFCSLLSFQKNLLKYS